MRWNFQKGKQWNANDGSDNVNEEGWLDRHSGQKGAADCWRHNHGHVLEASIKASDTHKHTFGCNLRNERIDSGGLDSSAHWADSRYQKNNPQLPVAHEKTESQTQCGQGNQSIGADNQVFPVIAVCPHTGKEGNQYLWNKGDECGNGQHDPWGGGQGDVPDNGILSKGGSEQGNGLAG